MEYIFHLHSSLYQENLHSMNISGSFYSGKLDFWTWVYILIKSNAQFWLQKENRILF